MEMEIILNVTDDEAQDDLQRDFAEMLMVMFPAKINEMVQDAGKSIQESEKWKMAAAKTGKEMKKRFFLNVSLQKCCKLC